MNLYADIYCTRKYVILVTISNKTIPMRIAIKRFCSFFGAGAGAGAGAMRGPGPGPVPGPPYFTMFNNSMVFEVAAVLDGSWIWRLVPGAGAGDNML